MSQNERRARLDMAVRDRLLAEIARLDAPAVAAEVAPVPRATSPVLAAPPTAETPMPDRPPAPRVVEATLIGDEVPPLPPLPPEVARLAARPAARPATAAPVVATPALPSAPTPAAEPAPQASPAPPVAVSAPQPTAEPQAPPPQPTAVPRLAPIPPTPPSAGNQSLIGTRKPKPEAPVVEPVTDVRPADPAPAPLLRSDAVAPSQTPRRPAPRPERPPSAPLVLRNDPPPEAPVVVPSPPRSPDTAWAALGQIALDEDILDRNLVITAARKDPAHGAFDVLRTRLLGALAEHGWTRVGITSPTKGCGKSFTAMNLAVALSRYDGRRTMLMDMDMRVPSLARSLGVTNPGSLGDVLRGLTPAAQHLRRVAPNRLHIGHLALGLNSQPESFAAELFQEPRTADVLAQVQADYRPDVMLFDLPPALAQDDVIAFRPHFDCILMVVGGGMTSAREVRESIRRLGEDKPVVGIVLNRAEGQGVGEYAYH